MDQTNDNEAIAFANIEHFMILDIEGIISDDIELNQVAFEPLKPISDDLTPIVFENDNVPKVVLASAMKNPIQPLTSFVVKKTNTIVDMETRKKAEGKKEGSSLKLENSKYRKTSTKFFWK